MTRRLQGGEQRSKGPITHHAIASPEATKDRGGGVCRLDPNCCATVTTSGMVSR